MASEVNPYSPIAIRQFLQNTQFHPSRKMGQNFLADEGTINKIISASTITKSDWALEIGPGLGALTLGLSNAAGRVIAVELDKRLADLLQQTFQNTPGTTIIQQDFLKLSLDQAFGAPFETGVVVANIPYSITSPIIQKLLENKSLFRMIALLVQKEVAERVVASAGTGDYSSFSVYCQYHAEVSIAFPVPRHLFLPVPEVGSSLLLIAPTASRLEPEAERWFFKVVSTCFQQRRKSIVNPLSSGLGMSKDKVTQACQKANINPGSRAEELSVQGFMDLSIALLP